MHIIKIGSLYLTSNGSLSPRQSDALRVVRLDSGNLSPRFVKLTPRATADQTSGQDTDQTSTSGQDGGL